METPDQTKNMEIPGTDGLDEFTTENASSSEKRSSSSELISVVGAETSPDAVTPPHLSRMDAVRSRRAKSSAASRFRRRAATLRQRARESGRSMAGYAPAVLAWLARPRGWLSYGAAHGASTVWRLGVAVRRVPAAVGRAILASRTVLGDRHASRREPTGTLNALESEGSLIAAALAIAVVSVRRSAAGVLEAPRHSRLRRIADAARGCHRDGPGAGCRLTSRAAGDPPIPAVRPADSPALDDQPLPRQRMSQAALTAVWDQRHAIAAGRAEQRQAADARAPSLRHADDGNGPGGGSLRRLEPRDLHDRFPAYAGHWVIQRVSSR